SSFFLLFPFFSSLFSFHLFFLSFSLTPSFGVAFLVFWGLPVLFDMPGGCCLTGGCSRLVPAEGGLVVLSMMSYIICMYLAYLWPKIRHPWTFSYLVGYCSFWS